MIDQLLAGHTSRETAYIQLDYPYGRSLRCQRAVWIETATKGQHKWEMRFVAQTSNPKRRDDWNNKPKASTYYPFAWMYLDQTTEGEIGHVKWGVLSFHTSVKEMELFKAKWLNQIQKDPVLLNQLEAFEKIWSRTIL